MWLSWGEEREEEGVCGENNYLQRVPCISFTLRYLHLILCCTNFLKVEFHFGDFWIL